MSDHVVGIVAKITSKEAGKNHNLIYNICIEEEGRDDEWYGYGWDEPEFSEGAEIEFDIEWNGDYPNVDTSTVNVISEGDGGGSSNSRGNNRSSGRSSGGNSRSSGRSSNSRGGSRNSSSSKPSSSKRSSSGNRGSANKGKGKGAADATMSKDEWADKDRMIRRQACMNTSIKLVGLLFEVGALKLPTKKADQYDAVTAACDEEAERLYDQYEEQVYGGGTAKRGGSRNQDNKYEDDIPE